MIYGYNFNGTPIPTDVRKRFDDWTRPNPQQPKSVFLLQGVCNTPEEQNAMAITARNGHRTWIWRTEVIGSKTWYGMFVC